jgi:hypothetical protein
MEEEGAYGKAVPRSWGSRGPERKERKMSWYPT